MKRPGRLARWHAKTLFAAAREVVTDPETLRRLHERTFVLVLPQREPLGAEGRP
jgi:hypothetical protein